MSENLIGQTFGRFTILSIEPPKRRRRCVAKCSCGTVKSYEFHLIKRGHTQSCGCSRRKPLEKNIIHGLTKHPLFGVWSDMKRRCYCKTSKKYQDWGARGITVCAEWLNDFQTFYNWAITHDYQKGLLLDREKNDGNYEPSNCRFVTVKISNRNKRSNRLITFKNQTKSLIEWAEFLKVSYTTLHGRLNKYKWPIEKALAKPKKRNQL